MVGKGLVIWTLTQATLDLSVSSLPLLPPLLRRPHFPVFLVQSCFCAHSFVRVRACRVQLAARATAAVTAERVRAVRSAEVVDAKVC